MSSFYRQMSQEIFRKHVLNLFSKIQQVILFQNNITLEQQNIENKLSSLDNNISILQNDYLESQNTDNLTAYDNMRNYINNNEKLANKDPTAIEQDDFILFYDEDNNSLVIEKSSK